MSKRLVCGVVFVTAIAIALPPPGALAQLKFAPVKETGASEFNVQQLDALLAPIALYPDELLIQMLMASTYPVQIVAAARWLEKDDKKSLKGKALVKALEQENWDPSVKSLVPFPQVIATMNQNLEWTQQLGYAVANQQAGVLDAVQRLRRQAQKTGNLKTTEQQRVVVQEETIVIEPASSETVFVPIYQPANVYGEWPYPETPPVYLPPPPEYYPTAYAPGYVWGTALAFAAGAAIVGGLWGWARPGWRYGNVSVNPLRYNNINVNRAQIRSGNWQAGAAGIAGRPIRAPGGPVGAPARASGLPTNAIGRGNVQVPGGAVNRPQMGAAGAGLGQRRPGSVGGVQRPGGGISAGSRPSQLPARAAGPNVLRGGSGGGFQRGGAFAGVGDGARASQFGTRGMQSRSFQKSGASAFTGRGGYGGGFQAHRGGHGGGFRGSAGYGGGFQARGGGAYAGGFRSGGGGFRGRR